MLSRQDVELHNSDHSIKQEAQLEYALSQNEKPDHSFGTTLKTIRIIGLVLRNFSGSLLGDKKLLLVSECYALGLRAIGVIFEEVDKKADKMLAELAKKDFLSTLNSPDDISHHYFRATERVANEITNHLYNMLQILSLVIIKYVASSISTEKANKTFEVASSKASNQFVKVLDLAVKLEQVSKFPKKSVLELNKLFKDNIFALNVVQMLTWLQFYLYPYDRKLVEEICNELEISLTMRKTLMNPQSKKALGNPDVQSRKSAEKQKRKNRRK